MQPATENPVPWVDEYFRILGGLFDRNAGGFPFSPMAADIRDAWSRAVNCWQSAPDRQAAILARWRLALSRFSNRTAAPQQQPLYAIDGLHQLHRELRVCLRALADDAPGLAHADRRLLRFNVRHLLHALAPENWPVSNPEVLKAAMASNGASLLQGLKNFYQDAADSFSGLDVKTADARDFILGETLATTPGEVVFENELFQLIQYYPFTREVLPDPLLIVPPCINKYYVLDLTPGDSFVQWAVRQGHTVFMMSWVNPGAAHADLGLADYLQRGCVTAMDAVERIASSGRMHLAGYCIGGLLAACTAAYCAAGGDRRIGSLTLFNTMLDHEEPGDIGVFLSDRMLQALEEHLESRGVLDGRLMRQVFTMLREERMFWPYVVNNYYLGSAPAPNPVLYWNRDATNLPRRMLLELVRDMYRHNVLRNGDRYMLAGRRLDLAAIDAPVYALACRNDHIIPWRSAFASARLLQSMVSFVLVDSGHVMGVVHPPNKRSSGYWHAGEVADGAGADDWLARAAQHQGSWWPHWHAWMAERQGGCIAARFPGASDSKIIERAPGRYVKNYN
jgi:polyhydroxyalkanoate synthase